MTPSPTATSERAHVLDALRGFALLGILIAHAPGFSGWDYLSPAERTAVASSLDGALQFLRDVFVRAKFVSLFSLLFGIGFAIQHARATARGDAFAGRFRRRQLALLALGVAHSAVWHGDILLTYALLGLLLIPASDWPARRLFRVACALFVLRALWAPIMFAGSATLLPVAEALTGGSAGGGEGGLSDRRIAEWMAGAYSPQWSALIAGNAKFLAIKWVHFVYEGRLISIGAFFLLGAAIAKSGGYAALHRIVSPSARWALLAAALLGNLALALLWPCTPIFPPTPLGLATNLAYAVAVPALAVAYAIGIAWLWERGAFSRTLGLLVTPGRMALSVYLSQTAVQIAVFYGVGLGYRGSLSLLEATLFAFALFALQVLLARLWLKHFQFGPLEWLWRCATYRRWLRLRTGPSARAPRDAGLEEASART